MRPTMSYEEDLAKSLRNPKEASAYLSAALAERDPENFLLALKDVAKALGGGMAQLSRKTGLNRENLYRMLSEKGNPELRSLGILLDAMGLKLQIEAKAAS